MQAGALAYYLDKIYAMNGSTHLYRQWQSSLSLVLATESQRAGDLAHHSRLSCGTTSRTN